MTDVQKKKIEDILNQFPTVNDSLRKYTTQIVCSINEADLDNFVFDLMTDSEGINLYGMGKLCLPMVYRYAQRYIEDEVGDVVCEIASIINEKRNLFYEGDKEIAESFKGIKYKGEEVFSSMDFQVSLGLRDGVGGNSFIEKMLTKRVSEIEVEKRVSDPKISRALAYKIAR